MKPNDAERMEPRLTIHWFRQDLRVTDNPGLYFAAQQGPLLPLYILDDNNAGEYKMGSASRVWLHHSLGLLNTALNNRLLLFCGDPLTIITELVNNYAVTDVHWNRCYEPWRTQRDEAIKLNLTRLGIRVKSFNASLLWEPWDILNNNKQPYQLFTAFYRHGCLLAAAPREPLPPPQNLHLIQAKSTGLKLLPKVRWDSALMQHWKPGELEAKIALHNFLSHGLQNYREGRNFPALTNVSRLSPYLHFGEISPHQIWYSLQHFANDPNIDHFCQELAWREYAYYLLYHHPSLPYQALKSKFVTFPWQNDPVKLARWQQGKTGIPIVDAGMRELWQTGYMHNRVRMIVGSFLVKNLLISWQVGAAWFWDCLLDADLASNSTNWQWVAGCGVDSAPFFRIFNPVLQGQKFDPQGEYTRLYVNELKRLPTRYLFNPWEAPLHVLQQAEIELGKTYPKPIVDLKQSRAAALAAFQGLTR